VEVIGTSKIQKLRSSMAVNIIGAIVLVLAVFGIIAGTVGFVSFMNALKKEYDVTGVRLG
jgi:hypothetical protein